MVTSRPMGELRPFTRTLLSGSCLLGALLLGTGLLCGAGAIVHATQEVPEQADGQATATAPAVPVLLRPTAHPPLPSKGADVWFVPAAARSAAPAAPALKGLIDGIESIDNEDFAIALPKVSDPRLARTPVAEYASYYTALAQLRTGKVDRARDGFKALNARGLQGVLTEWATLGEAQAAEAQGDYAAAARLFESASKQNPAAPDEVLTAVARNMLASGQRDAALELFRKIYYQFPLSSLAETARQQVIAITGEDERTRVKREAVPELGRAQRLFGAKRYAEALSTFQALSDITSGDDQEVVQLRIAESQHFLGRYRDAIDGTRPFISRASRKAEARFFYLSALRGAGDQTGYVSEARRLVQDFPDSPWAEETLNNLGTHYILTSDDAAASDVFREYLERFPTGRYAQRASWKYGWARYRQQDYQTAITVFERAAANFPRSDFRPPYLYWAARAYDHLNQPAPANLRYSLVVVDYLNSYYGRLADEQLKSRGVARAERTALVTRVADAAPAPAPAAASASAGTGTGTASAAPATPAAQASSSGATAASASPDGTSNTPPPTDARIRKLIAAGLDRTALAEVDYARRVWGPSPQLDATAAWLYRELGDLRRGINAMKRAYPQYLTADADQLPKSVRQVIFPLEYWSSIRRQATARGLDPYLVAALIAQESNFQADARSPANAYGLMQIVPSTGRQLARSLGIRRFKTTLLTNPEMSIRLGTLHFQKVLRQFNGSAYYALASYNAGESKVVRWISERGTLPQDEFIDDIPYPETQNYVKRILGTAEDYRVLYTDAGS